MNAPAPRPLDDNSLGYALGRFLGLSEATGLDHGNSFPELETIDAPIRTLNPNLWPPCHICGLKIDACQGHDADREVA